jgi:hypothetical protein
MNSPSVFYTPVLIGIKSGCLQSKQLASICPGSAWHLQMACPIVKSSNVACEASNLLEQVACHKKLAQTSGFPVTNLLRQVAFQ